MVVFEDCLFRDLVFMFEVFLVFVCLFGWLVGLGPHPLLHSGYFCLCTPCLGLETIWDAWDPIQVSHIQGKPLYG